MADGFCELDNLCCAVGEPSSRPIVVCMADVEPREVQWLWLGRVPLARLSILIGIPGEGKSFVSLDLAARISRGATFPDGAPCPSGSTILVTCEDDPNDTQRPRLDAALADVSRIHLLSGVRHVDADGQAYEMMFTLADLDPLEVVLRDHRDCRLVVVDPVGSFLGGKCDAHRDNEVRSILAPLGKLAEKYGPAVLLIAHRRKLASGSADETALGSRAFTGIARSVLHIIGDRQDRARHLFLPGKCNLTAPGAGLAYHIVSDDQGRGVVAWEAGEVDKSADDALAEERGTGQRESARTEVAEWLRSYLGDGMARPSAEVEAAAKAAGFSKRTLWRTKTECGVVAKCSGYQGTWTWRLPQNQAKNQSLPRLSQEENVAHCGTHCDTLNNKAETQSVSEYNRGCQAIFLGETGHTLNGASETPPDSTRHETEETGDAPRMALPSSLVVGLVRAE